MSPPARCPRLVRRACIPRRAPCLPVRRSLFRRHRRGRRAADAPLVRSDAAPSELAQELLVRAVARPHVHARRGRRALGGRRGGGGHPRSAWLCALVGSVRGAAGMQ
eukprot:7377517-Prymnesium_polylepis.2